VSAARRGSFWLGLGVDRIGAYRVYTLRCVNSAEGADSPIHS
jgi:hypothetical protein